MLKNQRYSDIFYDRIYAEREDIGFYLNIAKHYLGPILEAACGTGRILVPTARQGATILGFDLCEPRVILCREKLTRERAPVRARTKVEVGNLLDCDFGSKFNLITMPFRGFQDLITVEEEHQALLNMHRHLLPGGRLVMDVFNPSIPFLADQAPFEEFAEEGFSVPNEGLEVRLAYRLLHRDYFLQTQEVEEIIYLEQSGGRQDRQTRTFTTRYLFRYELEYLLNLTGFKVEHVYGDFDMSPFGVRYPGELIVVARKRS